MRDALIAAVSTAALSGTAFAGPSTLILGTDFDVKVTMGGSNTGYVASEDLGALAVDLDANGGTDAAFDATLVAGINAFNSNWDFETFNLVLDTDPEITSAFAMANTAGVDMRFTVTVSILSDVALSAISDVTGTSFATVSDRSSDSSAFINTVGGGALTDFDIDGATDQELLLNNIATSGFPGITTADGDSVSTTTTTPVLVGTELAIVNDFILSEGDAVTFNSAFQIVPAPAGTIALVGLGAMVARRRR